MLRLFFVIFINGDLVFINFLVSNCKEEDIGHNDYPFP